MPDVRFLSDGDRQRVFARARRVTGPRGTHLLEQGARKHELFLLRKGYVRVERGPRYRLTDTALTGLRATGVPDGVIEALARLQGQEFDSAEDLTRELARVLTPDDLARYGAAAADQARPADAPGVAVARLGPGEVFGELSFLEDAGANASVIAEEDVEVDVAEGPDIAALLASDPALAARFYQSLAVVMAHRLRNTTHSLALLREQANARRPGEDRAEQLAQQQVPADLRADVAEFTTALQSLAARLKAPDTAAAAAREAPQQVNAALERLRQALERHTRNPDLVAIGYDDALGFRDTDQLAAGVGGYVIRESFPIIMTSSTMARCYLKPRGYVEDRETLQRIYDNRPEGEVPLGPYLDRWFLSRPVCEARRNGRRRTTALIQEVAARETRPGPIRITSLACGTADELFDLPAELAGRVYATCIGDDPEALRALSETAAGLGETRHITFLQANVAGLARGLGRVDLGPQRLIYGLGMCDYLTDEQLAGKPPDRSHSLFNWLYDHLEPGGWLALDNLSANNPDLRFLEYVLEWRVNARTEERLRGLLAGSRFAGGPLKVEKDEGGLFLVVGRP
jgi:CRP-like cAMP-binding protein